MAEKYFTPEFDTSGFHCSFCNVFAHQFWMSANYYEADIQEYSAIKNIKLSQCQHCWGISIWYEKKMVYPNNSSQFMPHDEMPEDLKSDYVEASKIFHQSPRGATALLRLVIQKLMPHLGEKGKNINDDIASLVKKGLPVTVQRALDYCRVIGNSAVHPAELNIQDTPEIAKVLFEMINFIIEDRIARPKQIDHLYNSLPENAKKYIEERDKPKESNFK